MRYLLVDHIREYSPNEIIRGVKNVAMSEDFLEFHFPGNPIMPGVLLLEALTQLAGWLEAVSSDFRNWVLISKVIKSNFYGFALPGDQVELEVRQLPGQSPDVRLYSGMGFVSGKKKIVAEFEGTVLPIEELEDAETQRLFFHVMMRKARR